MPTKCPVFVIGSPRTGTSIVTEALAQGVGLPGFQEGHFVELLLRLLMEIEAHYREMAGVLNVKQHMISHVPEAAIRADVVALFRARVDGFYPGAAWVDKTPGPIMIKGSPWLLHMWPNAKIVFMKRRGIENVLSRLRKYPDIPFADHCGMWARTMEFWQQRRPLLGASCIEIDQWDIARKPEDVSDRLGTFLGVEPAVRAVMLQIFRESTPEDTGGARRQQAPALEETGWTAQQVATFREICGPMLAAFGYSEDAAYYRPA